MTLQIKSIEQYHEAYKKSVEDPEGFWAEQAETFTWHQKWHTVLKNDFVTPDVRWFEGGKLNITENCLDRHIATKGDQTAIIWEANEANERSLKYTYKELLAEVNKCANALKAQGVKKGDRICFYMPMIPQVAIAMLACARIGAIHSVVFAGFSANALADRIKDSECKMVICSDYNRRGPKNIPVKEVVDEAIAMGCDSVEKVLVYQTTGGKVEWNDNLDLWWHETVDGMSTECAAESMDAEDMLFILYTSGSTGKPKGVVHTCGGYMVYTCYSFKNVFQYQDGDIYWCTADVGWITGHSYIIYGPLLAGATTMMFEGVPGHPDAGRFWHVCEKHRVNQFYTAPTAIRALMSAGWHEPEKYDLSSLKVIGSVGEPINEEAWHWYDDKVGRGQAPIVDTWWQTETGGIMITPLPGITDAKPCFASYPLPGIQPCLLDASGNELHGNDVEGLLCIKYPWPSILRTTYGDHERSRTNYFAAFHNMYFTGDGAKRDEDGRYRIIGRVDDVINVSGHRIGTAEVEDAIDQHSGVVESAVVGYPHDIKGQGIYAYVKPHHEVVDQDHFRKEILAVVTKHIGPIAKPDMIQFVTQLPKTRSGKIMRRILRKIAEGQTDQLGDTSTLLNPECVEELKAGALV
ncbi:MAG: acetate--CoA ligase [Saprospiraceae bacterium]|nr:acetate--CoA ligase [Saprospiraceae bacterium]MBK8887613.1 acetate--CoA ligase [Saprospiraceae bacterium]MBK9583616.1 acetate--CoA ligase [Saprospiraceae bacterium]HQV66541.1 acetate--CoA ligase [Saprospiraceae bacterium]